MKYASLLLITFMIIFSSCSGGGFLSAPAQSGTEQEDKTGYGLEVRFNIDDQDIQIGRVEYEITLKNSGKLPLTIYEQDFSLTTPDQKSSGSGTQDVFSSESVEAMKKKIFKESGQITLQKDQEVSISGLLEISDPFKNTQKETFEYKLKISYDYRTEFNNNVEIVLKRDSKPEFKVTDSISQAAPIQITDIEFNSDVKEGDYILEYTIQDRGKGGIVSDFSTDATRDKITVDRMEILFGSTSIYSRCDPWYKKSGKLSEEATNGLVLDKNKGDLVLYCRHSIPNTDGLVNTKTTGYMEYRYVYNDRGELNFPEEINRP